MADGYHMAKAFQNLPFFAEKLKMKAVIWAGGLGSRLSEETDAGPKPMVEIEGKPILWHIMSKILFQVFDPSQVLKRPLVIEKERLNFDE
jgi:molybdopterin-guanine dinucleotide biosynthesis protein A